ncbi:diguanylate cyclase [Halomonas sp. YLGW01]|uniref:sensor domain-containing diguanylate cyclase n=1 Tax=Halomonas sp. YLGW01 TaxID=2773308 RepID=UPI00177D61D6|nr:diguanylate cyclase [Halomonas sp. YLGW01]
MPQADAKTTALLDCLAGTPAPSEKLEALIYPLLDLLADITGLSSTYFTLIDEERQVQTVVYARNIGNLIIPEGLSVPWCDTLCRRAILEGRRYSQDVATHWGDSMAARELGLCTYLSEPVYLLDSTLYGTLCAASDEQVTLSPEVIHYMSLFTQLISRYLESERLLQLVTTENRILAHHANTDPLTGIANRRALVQGLEARLQHAALNGQHLYVAFIDLDGFKAINDRHGHDAGDRFLIELAQQLTRHCRKDDLIARYGGDEFVVVRESHTDTSEQAFRQYLEELTAGQFHICDDIIDYSGASVGTITAKPEQHDAAMLLSLCDAAMYEQKKARRHDIT